MFREIYDYHGNTMDKKKLRRKAEQVSTQSPTHKLFQKVYYHPDLLEVDENVLRTGFFAANKKNDKSIFYGQVFAAIAYWPFAYALSSRVKPVGVGLFTAFWYFGVYNTLI